MFVETLIEIAQPAARNDRTWLGSEAHRELIQEFAASRSDGVQVRWLPPGERSYTDGRVIAMERPKEDADTDETVWLHALIILHEVLHLAHSDDTGAQAFAHLLSQLTDFMERFGRDLFNHLEDARIAHREHLVEPANDRYVNDLHQLALEQEETRHRRFHNESSWTPTPTHQFPQLRMALVERIFVGNRDSELDPIVAEVVAESGPTINAGITSETTAGARTATLQILEIVGRRIAELTAGPH